MEDEPFDTSSGKGGNAMQTTPLITHVLGTKQDPTTSPMTVLVETDTENGPLVLKATITAAHELRAVLRRLTPDHRSLSGVKKL